MKGGGGEELTILKEFLVFDGTLGKFKIIL